MGLDKLADEFPPLDRHQQSRFRVVDPEKFVSRQRFLRAWEQENFQHHPARRLPSAEVLSILHRKDCAPTSKLPRVPLWPSIEFPGCGCFAFSILQPVPAVCCSDDQNVVLYQFELRSRLAAISMILYCYRTELPKEATWSL
jgi:hypothetical protein